ncbi:Calmodulin-lysine N-methyltransferase [Morella rubra]|uniref:Calmodulin-lysine N-methyltransferase n=1 Tax=Morella rubra TaxID=262757 RepID=A0A6A1UGP4_9ROSI|nr:Calmodulin-lysine N-methyltransferase [Morella rubra]
MEASRTPTKASSLRWQILRQALLRRPPPLIPVGEGEEEEEDRLETGIRRVSRRASPGFNLIPCHVVEEDVAVLDSGSLKLSGQAREARVCYTLPIEGAPRLILTQRVDERAVLGDFEICNLYNVDNTGLVCHWPSEDVLAYFCLSHADMFRYKRVIELGSGYGLAGLVIAAITEASEVVISDGNPQVVDYIQHNIDANSGAFGATRVNSMNLHWDQEEISNISNAFDVIIASDCTFFKEFHYGLARLIKLLLKKTGSSEAIFFSPKRGNSLDKFLETIKQSGLCFTVTENYDAEVWKRHQAFMHGTDSWPGYEKDHCYPLMIGITM